MSYRKKGPLLKYRKSEVLKKLDVSSDYMLQYAREAVEPGQIEEWKSHYESILDQRNVAWRAHEELEKRLTDTAKRLADVKRRLVVSWGLLLISCLVSLFLAAHPAAPRSAVHLEAPRSVAHSASLKSTVAGLPVAGSSSGYVYMVTDGASASDCSVGGGTYTLICRSNGSSWNALTATRKAVMDRVAE